MSDDREDRIIRLKTENDIVQTVEKYVALKPESNGKLFKGICPVHTEKTPSFTVDSEKQSYNCYGCGIHGDVIDFIVEVECMTKHEAINFLDSDATSDISPAPPRPTKEKKSLDLNWLYNDKCQPNNDKAKKYFRSRKINITDELIDEIGIKYNEYQGKNDTELRSMLVVPMYGISGEILSLTRIFINEHCQKLGKKEMLGSTEFDRCTLIKNDPKRLAIFEGLEDGLTYYLNSNTKDSVLITYGKSGFGRISSFTDQFESCGIFLDPDENEWALKASVNLPPAVTCLLPGMAGIDANKALINGDFSEWYNSCQIVERPTGDEQESGVVPVVPTEPEPMPDLPAHITDNPPVVIGSCLIDLIKPEAWPDTRTVNKYPVPVSTIENLEYLLANLSVTARYNVISKDFELVDEASLYGSLEGGVNAAINDIISHACRHGLPKGDVPGYLQAIAYKNHFNPVKEWILSEPYRKEDDHIDLLCQTVTAQDHYNSSFKDVLIKKWLISAVAMACNDDARLWSKGVLTFQGAQDVGKTSWFWKLLPKHGHDWGIEALALQPGQKDSETKAARHWLAELGELDATFKKSDIAAIKGYLTSRKDTIRLPYDRKESVFPRRTAFFASVNPHEFLHDETGNTRFWVVPVQHLDFTHDIDIQQMWAQVYELYLSGKKWFLSGKEALHLEVCNSDYVEIHPIEEMILRYIDTGSFPTKTFMTATDMLLLLDVKNPGHAERTIAGAAMRKYFGKCYKRGDRRVYEVKSAVPER